MKMNIIQQIDRIKRLSIYIIAMLIRACTTINKKRVFMVSYALNKYACNPKAFTEFLLSSHPNEYEIYWAFNKDIEIADIDNRIHVVRRNTFAYFIAMYTSKYIFNNHRNSRMYTMFNKKKGQIYIQTWHGSFALKKIEKDAAEALGEYYVKRAIDDSKMCDLMLSNSRLLTKQIRESFWYDGEILENCMPRNCIFYDKEAIDKAYINIRKKMHFQNDCKIVLYAPTFRGGSKSLDYYMIDWDKIIPLFEKMFGNNDVKVLLRLHPNMKNFKDISSITNFKNVYNVTQEPDITEFLFAADAMISDYTSAMFDYIILNKPCFIYAIDKDEYDRGFYHTLDSLPFSLATNNDELAKNIKEFNALDYQNKITDFKNNIWMLDEDGKGCDRLFNWMLNH